MHASKHTAVWLACVLLVGSAACAATAPADAPTVKLAEGQVRGEKLDVDGAEVDVYRGIPFAAPPVGALRWRPPQPAAPWDGVRECLRFAPACPQPADLAYGFHYTDQSEDCLYLNVWTAAKAEAEKRPVMVWIHGGGNSIGGAAAPAYDGRHFAAAGVVLVSVQYRLGAFGYLAHPALTAEAERLDGRGASGNYGLMDQIAALKWVQANIERLGGDPKRVTVFGESAGAANVTFLMASPLAEGLFHRAIAQSGHFGPNTSNLTRSQGPRNVSAHQTGLDFAARLGVKGADDAALTALRQLPAEKLLSVPLRVGSIVGKGGGRAFRLAPVVDGWVLPRDPQDVWAAGDVHKVPFIGGSLLDDGSVFSRANPVRRLFGYRLVMRSIFGPDADRALAVFPAARDEDVQAAVHRVTTLLSFRAPARRLVRWVDAAGGDAWLYHFTRNPGKGRAAREGVFHGLEIAYVFQSLKSLGDETDKRVAADMTARWVRFARSGDPNGAPGEPDPPQPAWPKYQAAKDPHLEFGDRVRVGEGLDREACDLMDRVAERRAKE